MYTRDIFMNSILHDHNILTYVCLTRQFFFMRSGFINLPMYAINIMVFCEV